MAQKRGLSALAGQRVRHPPHCGTRPHGPATGAVHWRRTAPGGWRPRTHPATTRSPRPSLPRRCRRSGRRRRPPRAAHRFASVAPGFLRPFPPPLRFAAAALPLRCRCAAAAPPPRCRRAAAAPPRRRRRAAAALPPRRRRAAAAPPPRRRRAAAALPPRCRCGSWTGERRLPLHPGCRDSLLAPLSLLRYSAPYGAAFGTPAGSTAHRRLSLPLAPWSVSGAAALAAAPGPRLRPALLPSAVAFTTVRGAYVPTKPLIRGVLVCLSGVPPYLFLPALFTPPSCACRLFLCADFAACVFLCLLSLPTASCSIL